MHFVTGCVNTAKKAPAQGTGHHVRSGPLQKKHKKGRKAKEEPEKRQGRKGSAKGSGCRLAVSQSVSRTYGHGATVVASHDATLRRGIQLVVVIA